MGIFKDTLKVINEIVTLGGAGRLEDAKRAYQEKHDEYLVLYNETRGYKSGPLHSPIIMAEYPEYCA